MFELYASLFKTLNIEINHAPKNNQYTFRLKNMVVKSLQYKSEKILDAVNRLMQHFSQFHELT